jgi:hypothetical protein
MLVRKPAASPERLHCASCPRRSVPQPQTLLTLDPKANEPSGWEVPWFCGERLISFDVSRSSAFPRARVIRAQMGLLRLSPTSTTLPACFRTQLNTCGQMNVATRLVCDCCWTHKKGPKRLCAHPFSVAVAKMRSPYERLIT